MKIIKPEVKEICKNIKQCHSSFFGRACGILVPPGQGLNPDSESAKS